jgi:hypothetical protein
MPELENNKVIAIFQELAGDRAFKLRGTHYPADINTRITTALTNETASDSEVLRQDGVGFHLVDWNEDAAFIVALILFPERFTDEEIRDGVESFLIHAPAHILEAARLAGYSTKNIFLENPQDPKTGK